MRKIRKLHEMVDYINTYLNIKVTYYELKTKCLNNVLPNIKIGNVFYVYKDETIDYYLGGIQK
jgi:hypothetical protein